MLTFLVTLWRADAEPLEFLIEAFGPFDAIDQVRDRAVGQDVVGVNVEEM